MSILKVKLFLCAQSLFSIEIKSCRGFVSETEYTGHTGYVTSICSLHPSDQWPDGLTFTGSRDSTILVYNPSCASALQQLKGHTDTGNLPTFQFSLVAVLYEIICTRLIFISEIL
jgi:WD40 repeat protein